MQDEVLKHTRKIYNTMKSREHGFWEKAREVAVEIFIIVFAVTLSIWLHNWSEHRAEQRTTEEFLAGLRADLQNDVQTLEDDIKSSREERSYFQFLENANKTKNIDRVPDSVIAQHFNYQLMSTPPNDARYEGFKSSGKLGTIESDSLKQAILN